MSFHWPVALLALLAVPVALAAVLLLERRRARYAVRFTNLEVLAAVAERSRPWRRLVPLALFLLALATLGTALARPRVRILVPDERARIILAIDVSGSMRARDVRPTRLGAAKAAVDTFLDRVPKQFQIGVVSFSTEPQVVALPTHDRERVRAALRLLEPAGGTSIGDAIERGVELGDPSAAREGPPQRPRPAGRRPTAAILLLSDGFQTTGQLSPQEGADRAKARGIPVYTIALGTPSGAIVVSRGGFTQEVSVPPDPVTLRQVAESTDGAFFAAPDARQLTAVYRKLGSRVGRKPERREVTNLFVGGGALLLLAAGALSGLWLPRLP